MRRIHPILLSITLLAACGAAAPTVQAPVERESLTILATDATWTMDPLSIEAASILRTSHVYEALVDVDPEFRVIPMLADAWGTIDDRTWEFRVRAGVTFHDGTPVTAKSVVASYEYVREKGGEDVQALLSTIDRIDADDQYSLRVRTLVPDPLLLRRLRLLRIANYESETEPPPGTGPYTVTRITPENLELTASPTYWGAAPVSVKLFIKAVQDADERTSMLTSGKAEILADVPPALAQNPPDTVRLATRTSLRATYLVLHPQPETFLVDPHARAAVDLAIDRSALEAFAPGYLVPTHQILPTAVFGSDPRAPERAFDLSAAKKELQQVTVADPAFTLLADASLRKLADLLRTQLQAAGIVVTVQEIDGSALGAALTNGTYDAALVGWSFDVGDPQDFLAAFVHTPDATRGKLNHLDIGSRDFDGAIEVAATKIKPQERLKLIQGVISELDTERVFLPLFTSQSVVATSRDLLLPARVDGIVVVRDVQLQQAAPSSAESQDGV